MYESNIEIKKDIEILIKKIKNNSEIKTNEILEELEKINLNIKLEKIKPSPIIMEKQNIGTELKLLLEENGVDKLLKQQDDRQKEILLNLEKNIMSIPVQNDPMINFINDDNYLECEQEAQTNLSPIQIEIIFKWKNLIRKFDKKNWFIYNIWINTNNIL